MPELKSQLLSLAEQVPRPEEEEEPQEPQEAEITREPEEQ